MKPSKRGIRLTAACTVVALLPAFGLPQAWPLVGLTWACLVVAFAADAAFSPRERDLEVDWELPSVLYIARAAEARIVARFSSVRLVPTDVTLDLSEDLDPVEPQGVLLDDEAASILFELTARRRGTVEVERLWVRYSSPLGLWNRTSTFEIGAELSVLPDLPMVRVLALRFYSDPTFRAGLKIEKYLGDGTEFDSLKEFAVGEDHRSVDWKASARHRKLLTRQFRAERNHQVVLAVDSGHLMSEVIDGAPKLDHALNSALLLAYVCLKSGDRVGFFSFDSKVGPRLEAVRGVGALNELVNVTSRVAYSYEETNFTLGLTTLTQTLRKRSLIVLLTDFADTVTSELMFENIDRLGRRHVILFVSIRDPLLKNETRVPPESPMDLHRAVVAGGLLRERATVHRRLHRAGIRPLDVEPHEIGPELIANYLDIKRRERV